MISMTVLSPSRPARIALAGLAPLFAAALLMVAPARTTLADVVTAKSGTSQIEIDGTVLGIEGGQITVRVKQSGRETSKKLEDVIKIKLEDEPKFTAAEEAYAAGNVAAAAAQYQAALNATTRDWVKDRALGRLVDVAQKTGQFPAAVTAFVEMAKRDAAQAAKAKPPIPPKSTAATLGGSIEYVKKAYEGNVKPETKLLLRTYLVDLYLAAGDPASADAILKQAGGAAAAEPRPAQPEPGADKFRAGNPPPAVAESAATRALNEAKVAMAQKDYPRVAGTIRAARASFTDPDQQFEALYMVAEADAAIAGNDPARLQDAALSYMRIVAHFGSRASDPRYGDALIKTAGLVERLNKPNEALQLYNQVVTDPKLKGTPAAEQANKAIARLKASAQR